MGKRIHLLQRLIAAGVVCTFVLTNLSLSTPAFAAFEVEIPARELTPSIQIPAELGSVEEIYVPSERGLAPASPAGRPFVIHIQTAHGSYEGAKKIEAILGHLNQSYGVKKILLEGAAGRLEPELDRYFRDEKLNRKVLEYRAERGQASGASLFLLDAPSSVEAQGIEFIPAYRRNRSAFQEVFRLLKDSEKPLQDLNRKVRNLRAGLPKPLRDFLTRREAFERDTVPAADWFHYLQKSAHRILGIRLLDQASQKDWPNLLRLARLEKIESKLDREKFEKEKQAFLKAIRRFLSPPLLQELKNLLDKHPLPYGHARFLLERVVDTLPPSYSLERSPSLKAFLQILVFRNEIRGDLLFAEFDRLANEIQRSLAGDDRPKKAVELLEDYALLKRLLALELTPRDYGKLKEKTAESITGLDLLYDKALQFYRGAREREGLMARNIARVMEKAADKPVVVITGGFHTPGLKAYFKSRGLAYVLVVPKLTGAPSREAYLDSMLDRKPSDLSRATLEHAGVYPVGLPRLKRLLGVKGYRSEVRRRLWAIRASIPESPALKEEFLRSRFARDSARRSEARAVVGAEHLEEEINRVVEDEFKNDPPEKEIAFHFYGMPGQLSGILPPPEPGRLPVVWTLGQVRGQGNQIVQGIERHKKIWDPEAQYEVSVDHDHHAVVIHKIAATDSSPPRSEVRASDELPIVRTGHLGPFIREAVRRASQTPSGRVQIWGKQIFTKHHIPNTPARGKFRSAPQAVSEAIDYLIDRFEKQRQGEGESIQTQIDRVFLKPGIRETELKGKDLRDYVVLSKQYSDFFKKFFKSPLWKEEFRNSQGKVSIVILGNEPNATRFVYFENERKYGILSVTLARYAMRLREGAFEALSQDKEALAALLLRGLFRLFYREYLGTNDDDIQSKELGIDEEIAIEILKYVVDPGGHLDRHIKRFIQEEFAERERLQKGSRELLSQHALSAGRSYDVSFFNEKDEKDRRNYWAYLDLQQIARGIDQGKIFAYEDARAPGGLGFQFFLGYKPDDLTEPGTRAESRSAPSGRSGLGPEQAKSFDKLRMVSEVEPRVERAEVRQQFEWGVERRWLEANRHRIVPIFISGGEAPGVNDYFAYAARELRKLGLIPVAVKYGIQGFIGSGFENRLAVIDEEAEQRLIGRGGSLAKTSRVNLLDSKVGSALNQALENMKGFPVYLAIGGGDHAIFWTKFANEIKKKEGISEELKKIVQDISDRTIVIYKTIDGDTHGQPLGFYTAARRAQEIIYSAAESGDGMGRTVVLGIMGADVGRLAVQAASRKPANLAFLEASRHQEERALAQQIKDYGDRVLILIPESSPSLQEVVDAVREIKKEKGSATVVVAEGFEVRENDPLLRQLIDPQSRFYNIDAEKAWTKALQAGRDPHGNIKRSETSPEILVTAALRRFLHPDEKVEAVRLAEKIGYGILRGAHPGYEDRIYARLLAEQVGRLVRGRRFGVVVSLPPDDRSIQQAFIRYLKRPAYLQKIFDFLEFLLKVLSFGHFHPPSLEDRAYEEIRKKRSLRIQSFQEVFRLKEERGPYNAFQANSPHELSELGVLLPTSPPSPRAEVRALEFDFESSAVQSFMGLLEAIKPYLAPENIGPNFFTIPFEDGHSFFMKHVSDRILEWEYRIYDPERKQWLVDQHRYHFEPLEEKISLTEKIFSRFESRAESPIAFQHVSDDEAPSMSAFSGFGYDKTKEIIAFFWTIPQDEHHKVRPFIPHHASLLKHLQFFYRIRSESRTGELPQSIRWKGMNKFDEIVFPNGEKVMINFTGGVHSLAGFEFMVPAAVGVYPLAQFEGNYARNWRQPFNNEWDQRKLEDEIKNKPAGPLRYKADTNKRLVFFDLRERKVVLMLRVRGVHDQTVDYELYDKVRFEEFQTEIEKRLKEKRYRLLPVPPPQDIIDHYILGRIHLPEEKKNEITNIHVLKKEAVDIAQWVPLLTALQAQIVMEKLGGKGEFEVQVQPAFTVLYKRTIRGKEVTETQNIPQRILVAPSRAVRSELRKEELTAHFKIDMKINQIPDPARAEVRTKPFRKGMGELLTAAIPEVYRRYQNPTTRRSHVEFTADYDPHPGEIEKKITERQLEKLLPRLMKAALKLREWLGEQSVYVSFSGHRQDFLKLLDFLSQSMWWERIVPKAEDAFALSAFNLPKLKELFVQNPKEFQELLQSFEFGAIEDFRLDHPEYFQERMTGEISLEQRIKELSRKIFSEIPKHLKEIEEGIKSGNKELAKWQVKIAPDLSQEEIERILSWLIEGSNEPYDAFDSIGNMYYSLSPYGVLAAFSLARNWDLKRVAASNVWKLGAPTYKWNTMMEVPQGISSLYRSFQFIEFLNGKGLASKAFRYFEEIYPLQEEYEKLYDVDGFPRSAVPSEEEIQARTREELKKGRPFKKPDEGSPRAEVRAIVNGTDLAGFRMWRLANKDDEAHLNREVSGKPISLVYHSPSVPKPYPWKYSQLFTYIINWTPGNPEIVLNKLTMKDLASDVVEKEEKRNGDQGFEMEGYFSVQIILGGNELIVKRLIPATPESGEMFLFGIVDPKRSEVREDSYSLTPTARTSRDVRGLKPAGRLLGNKGLLPDQTRTESLDSGSRVLPVVLSKALPSGGRARRVDVPSTVGVEGVSGVHAQKWLQSVSSQSKRYPKKTTPVKTGSLPRAEVRAEENIVIKDDGRVENVELHYDQAFFNVLPPAVLEQIKKTVTWEEMKYDKMSGRRSILIKLPEPIVIQGRNIKAIKIKGVINRDRWTGEISRPLMEDFVIGFGRPPIKIDFTPHGIPVTAKTENRPSGSMLLERAKQEYVMTRAIFEEGFNADYPIGYGEFTGLRFEDKPVGFVVLGIEDPTDSRIIALPPEDVPQAFYATGKTIRLLQQKGYLHTYSHIENFRFVKGDEVNIHDLDRMDRITAEMSSTAETFYRIYEFLNLVYSMAHFYPPDEYSGETRKKLIHRYFEGYFYDLSILPQQSENLYAEMLAFRKKIIRHHRGKEVIKDPNWFNVQIFQLVQQVTQSDREVHDIERPPQKFDTLNIMQLPAGRAEVRVGKKEIEQHIKNLKDPDAYVRIKAVRALLEIPPEAKTIPALLEARRDPVPSVSGEAYFALRRIGPESKKAVPLLIRLINQAFADKDVDWARFIATILSQIVPDPTILRSELRSGGVIPLQIEELLSLASRAEMRTDRHEGPEFIWEDLPGTPIFRRRRSDGQMVVFYAGKGRRRKGEWPQFPNLESFKENQPDHTKDNIPFWNAPPLADGSITIPYRPEESRIGVVRPNDLREAQAYLQDERGYIHPVEKEPEEQEFLEGLASTLESAKERRKYRGAFRVTAQFKHETYIQSEKIAFSRIYIHHQHGIIYALQGGEDVVGRLEEQADEGDRAPVPRDDVQLELKPGDAIRFGDYWDLVDLVIQKVESGQVTFRRTSNKIQFVLPDGGFAEEEERKVRIDEKLMLDVDGREISVTPTQDVHGNRLFFEIDRPQDMAVRPIHRAEVRADQGEEMEKVRRPLEAFVENQFSFRRREKFEDAIKDAIKKAEERGGETDSDKELLRKDVRSELRKLEEELAGERPVRFQTSLEAIYRFAKDDVEGIFRAEDYKILEGYLAVLPGPLRSLIETPSAEAALAEEPLGHFAEQAGTMIEDLGKSSGQILGREAAVKGKMGWLVSAKIFENYGPVLAALQALDPFLYVAVLAPGKSEGEISVLRQAAIELNRFSQKEAAPRKEIVIYRDPIAAVNFAKKFSTLVGVGLTEDVARLISRWSHTPVIQKPETDLSRVAAAKPELAQLLAKFSAQFARALESAA